MVPMLIDKKATLVSLLILFSLMISLANFPAVNAVEDSWIPLDPMPTPREKFEVVLLNDRFYVIGGSSQQTYFGINEEYDPSSDTWAIKSVMPNPRSGFGTFVFQNKIFCVGGYSTATSYLGVNEAYDPVSDTWEIKNSMPTNRSGMQTAMIDGKTYFLGGAIGYDYENSETIYSQTNEAYDPIAEIWEIKKSIPVNGDFVAHVLGDKVYCIFKNGIEVYDTKNDDWSQKASMPVPSVYSYYTVVVENRIYFLLPSEGGYNQIYDIESDSWSFGENIPIDIDQPTVVTTSGSFAPKQIYIIGGFIDFVDPVNTTYVYDPTEDNWSSGASMTISRYNVHVVLVNDILYGIGGAIGFQIKPTSITTVVEKYIPADYIPEFPTWAALPIVLMATVMCILYRKKLHKT